MTDQLLAGRRTSHGVDRAVIRYPRRPGSGVPGAPRRAAAGQRLALHRLLLHLLEPSKRLAHASAEPLAGLLVVALALYFFCQPLFFAEFLEPSVHLLDGLILSGPHPQHLISHPFGDWRKCVHREP